MIANAPSLRVSKRVVPARSDWPPRAAALESGSVLPKGLRRPKCSAPDPQSLGVASPVACLEVRFPLTAETLFGGQLVQALREQQSW
jgi:hypothetical protein